MDIRTQLRLSDGKGVILRTKKSINIERNENIERDISHPVSTFFAREAYEQAKCFVMKSKNVDDIRNENVNGNNAQTVGMVQLHSDEMMAMLKANSFVAYPVDVVLLN